MATRKVFCKYQEIIDLNTIGDTISVIGIHTPTGDTPQKMFPGFYHQYQKVKYLGCSVTAANAAQLPVDPLGVGYEAGLGNESVMDPRDVFDPILFHGCHGQDLGAILNKLYLQNSVPLTGSLDGFIEDANSDSDAGRSELVEGLYYKALTDHTWKKFGIQSGFRLRGLHPMVYSLATNHQITPSVKGPSVTLDGDGIAAVGPEIDGVGVGGLPLDWQLFTPRLVPFGAIDTRVPYAGEIPSVAGSDYSAWQNFVQAAENYSEFPKLFMGVLLLPMSRRVKQFLRVVITHKFVFYGFRGASLNQNILGSPSTYFMGPNEFGTTDSNDQIILGGSPEDGGGGTDVTYHLRTVNVLVRGTSSMTASNAQINKPTILDGSLEITPPGDAYKLVGPTTSVSWSATEDYGFSVIGGVVRAQFTIGYDGVVFSGAISVSPNDVSRTIYFEVEWDGSKFVAKQVNS